MRARDLPHIWWGKAYPSELRELLKYTRMCARGGEPWDRALRYAYRYHPDTLPQPLWRLCKELGPRIFDREPSFIEGDGVTILLTSNGRIPATVVHAYNKRTVLVHEDAAFVRGTGTGSALYLPATGSQDFIFTARADGSWRIRGSRSGNRLLYGRSFKYP